MNIKNHLRHLTDLGMTILLLGLMAYSVTEQPFHEWMGVSVFALFVVHHLLNAAWFCHLRKGRYTLLRGIQTLLVALLTVSVLLQIISGLAMSRYVLMPFKIPLSTSKARLLHLCFGYWSFLLMSVHLGFHWPALVGLGRRIIGGRSLSQGGRAALRIEGVAAALYGAACFVRQNMVDYLFLRTEFVFFDYEKSPILVLGELASIMVLWALAGYLIQRLAIGQKNKK